MKGCVDGCCHFRNWREPRPYGSTVAYEEFVECENPDIPEELFDTMELPAKSCEFFTPSAEKVIPKTTTTKVDPYERKIIGPRYLRYSGSDGYYVFDLKSLDVVRGKDGKMMIMPEKARIILFMKTLRDDAPVIIPRRFR